ncbi:YnbE family lipoprotein [Shewanella sp. GXUN23E]|uniref:YnbE family lipoprotein n=1 Tax=Shewanella sp. GXUN23E TaxID=3422498 RepID=UPI003D7CF6F0
MKLITHASLATLALLLGACTPTVKIEAPDKPIVIDLNVKVEHDIRIKVDKQVDSLLQDKSLF